jgi:putative hydrolase of the HAD superfamily
MSGQQLTGVPWGVLFDGDDTLWRTEPLYDEARQEARCVVAATGANGAQWEELQRRIDVENVPIFGFSPERFPTSCVQAYQVLCELHGTTADPVVVSRVRQAAQAVFEREPDLFPGTRETLSQLRDQGARLALLTKGDFLVQQRRVAQSGLESDFDIVRIVTEKLPDTIRSVVGELGVSPEHAWMVGNSVRSDVLPALEAGIRAIWIEAHVWEYERAHDHLVHERVTVVGLISDVPAAIESANDAASSSALSRPTLKSSNP